MGRLRVIGQSEAEAAMLEATGGGSILIEAQSSGWVCLCAAAGARDGAAPSRTAATGSGRSVAATVGKGNLERGPVHAAKSHGPRGTAAAMAPPVRRARGRRKGFPSVLQPLVLPALKNGGPTWPPANAEAVRVQACFSLIAAIEDTNLLHRGGNHGSLLRTKRCPNPFLIGAA